MSGLARFHRAAGRHAGATMTFRTDVGETLSVTALAVRRQEDSSLEVDIPGYVHFVDVLSADVPGVKPGWSVAVGDYDYEIEDPEPLSPSGEITRCHLVRREAQI